MNDCSITVINTTDDCPHHDSCLGCKIKYQHGVDKINTEYFSIGYVFRVVNEHMNYCNKTTIMRTQTSAYLVNHGSKLISEFDKKRISQESS